MNTYAARTALINGCIIGLHLDRAVSDLNRVHIALRSSGQPGLDEQIAALRARRREQIAANRVLAAQFAAAVDAEGLDYDAEYNRVVDAVDAAEAVIMA